MTTFDTETVETVVGTYTVQFIADDSPEQPYDEGFGLIRPNSREYIAIDQGTLPGDNGPGKVYRIPTPRSLVTSALGVSDDRWDWQERSPRAIVRYLSLLGVKGAHVISDRFTPDYLPSADRFETVDGIAWAPDDVPDESAGDYVQSVLAQWHAWAEGDVFGYNVVGPDGDDVDDGNVWGYYGYSREREYVMSEARDAINADVAKRVAIADREALERITAAKRAIAERKRDAAERIAQANAFGAGFLGVI